MVCTDSSSDFLFFRLFGCYYIGLERYNGIVHRLLIALWPGVSKVLTYTQLDELRLKGWNVATLSTARLGFVDFLGSKMIQPSRGAVNMCKDIHVRAQATLQLKRSLHIFAAYETRGREERVEPRRLLQWRQHQVEV